MTDVKIPEVVMERIHAELTKTIMETPDYINKIVKDLMTEPSRGSLSYNDPDAGKPYFERILRQELRRLIENSTIAALRENYKEAIDAVVKDNITQQEKVEGSLAYAFAKVLQDEWRVTVKTDFLFNKD